MGWDQVADMMSGRLVDVVMPYVFHSEYTSARCTANSLDVQPMPHETHKQSRPYDRLGNGTHSSCGADRRLPVPNDHALLTPRVPPYVDPVQARPAFHDGRDGRSLPFPNL